MQPSEILHRAADVLERRAAAMPTFYAEFVKVVEERTYGYRHVGRCPEWVGFATPDWAPPLAAWLRETAEAAHPAGCGCLPCIDGLHANALDFAQRVLTAAGEEVCP